MNEAKVERLERTMWELERIADELFDLGYHLKHVDTIFRRVFG